MPNKVHRMLFKIKVVEIQNMNIIKLIKNSSNNNNSIINNLYSKFLNKIYKMLILLNKLIIQVI